MSCGIEGHGRTLVQENGSSGSVWGTGEAPQMEGRSRRTDYLRTCARKCVHMCVLEPQTEILTCIFFWGRCPKRLTEEGGGEGKYLGEPNGQGQGPR